MLLIKTRFDAAAVASSIDLVLGGGRAGGVGQLKPEDGRNVDDALTGCSLT